MKSTWVKGLSPQEKLDCESEFRAAARLRERLKGLLEEKVDIARTKARSGNTYDSPNWSLVQADSIGYERAIFEIISIIS
jgi:hypothetical protein